VGFFAFLNQWWNFPFLVMLGLVAVFFVLQVIGILGHVGDHDHSIEHDHDHDVDHDHDHDHDGGGFGGLLSFFGVGRVPFMVVWVTLFIFAGFCGLLLNRFHFVNEGGAYRGWFFIVSLGVSLAVGLVGVKLFAGLVSKLVDTGGKGADKKQDLCGKVGVVASTRVDATFGEVRIRGPRGDEMLVHARVGKGEAALERGARVVLVEYDDKQDLFWATASPVEAEANVGEM
jgi:hypothetical protein